MASEILKRSPTSTGNRRVFTWAGWVKLNKSSTLTNCIWYVASGGSSEFQISIVASTGALNVYDYTPYAYQYQYITSRLLRDFSNWFHLVVAVDTTQVREDDRFKIYINGSLYNGSYSTEVTAGGINYNTRMNTPGEINYIGQNISGGSAYDANCELTDMFMIDGQALTPDVFGFYKVGKGYISAGSTQSTDFRPGQWVPKTPRVIKTAINNSGGFGVNGFYLPMNDSNNFGADFHCEPNSIIKLQENLPQPRCRIDGVGDYTGALRDDPFKQYLVLALPFVSGGLSSGFGDYSAAIKGSGTQKSFTANGNVAIANTAGYYGSSSYFDGNGDYLRTSTNISDFQFGTGDFTIETWLWKSANGVNNYDGVVTLGTDGSATDGWFLEVSATRGYLWYVAGSSQINYNVSPNTSQWNHLAVCRKANTTTMYLNGVAVGINTNTYTVPATATTLDVGVYAVGTGNFWFNGYLQDLRIYKGVAKYKGGFDVPRPYTPVGIATWRAVPDSPANNFATLNAIDKTTGGTLSDGNLKFVGGAGNHGAPGTIGFSTGKYYAEMYINDTPATNSYFGIFDTRSSGAAFVFKNIYLYQYNTGNKYGGEEESYLQTSYGNSVTTGDIISMAVDMVNKKLFFAKNGVWQNSSDPVSGTNSAFTVVTTNESFYIPWNNSNAAHTRTTNFGQNPSFSGNTTAGTYTDSNNKGLFKYQPPSGFLALCEDNLPTPAIANPGKYFKTVLYTGNGVPATSKSVVGVGFTPDLVWIKRRDVSTGDHKLVDSVRGAGFVLETNTTDIEGNETNNFTSFANDGFNLGANNATAWNESANYVAWCWRAGAGTTSTNTNGSITSVVSVNQDAGFSIVSYTGNGSAGATVGHGLGITPAMVIIKSRNEVRSWIVFHRGASPTPNPLSSTTFALGSLSSGCLSLNLANGTFAYTMDGQTNVNGNTYIAYCWAEIEGFSKFGSYTGNGSTDGPFVFTNGKPAFVMIKRTDSTGDWYLFDSSRNSSNPVSLGLLSNTTQIDGDYTGWGDFLSNGFKIRRTDGAWNASGGTYIFACWMESPFTTANSK